ncbi:MAG: right-handed parallel beta-helix repeat-containing protein [Solirubrobacterales bacterium]
MNRTSFPTRTLTTLTAACATAVALVAPAVASATDRWVDTDTGTNSGNTCTVQANPCKTIQQASDSSQIAGDFGTIHVDGGAYTENINIAQGNRVTADDFVSGDSGPATISGTGSGVAVFVQASASVSGFAISSPTSGSVVLVADSASAHDNTITAAGANSTAVEVFPSASGTPSVSDNTILADSGDEATGVVVDQNVAGRATVNGNQIGAATGGFDRGIWVKAGSKATIEGNTILGSRQLSGSNANGIRIDGADDVDVIDNDVRQPFIAAGKEADGVYATNLSATDSLDFERNRIVGMTGTGLVLTDVGGPVTSSNDILADNSDRAVFAGNAPDVTLTNTTIVGNESAPVFLNSATLAVDSSILDVPITTGGGTNHCEIAYSRGPAIVEGGTGCGEFQTTADPQFADRFASPVPDLELKPACCCSTWATPPTPARAPLTTRGTPAPSRATAPAPATAAATWAPRSSRPRSPTAPSPTRPPSATPPRPTAASPARRSSAVTRRGSR